MARHFGKEKPAVGVDIIFFDAEDYGAPADKMSPENENSWCLGSQYWASNKHIPGYRAKYGILLDMVGAPQARFYREQINYDIMIEVLKKLNIEKKAYFTFKIMTEFYEYEFLSEMLSRLDEYKSGDDEMKAIHDTKNKTTIYRDETFFEKTFAIETLYLEKLLIRYSFFL